MKDNRMPTTLPSPVDRGKFQFVALDAWGGEWRWVDEEMVWERKREADENTNGNSSPGPPRVRV